MKTIFYSDVDKTLMDDQKDYSQEIENMIKTIYQHNDILVPCSGRPSNSLLSTFKNYAVEYVIGYNGAQILDIDGNLIVDQGLTLAEVNEVSEALKSLELDYVLYDNDVYTNNIKNEYAATEARLTELNLKELSGNIASPKVLGLSNPELTDSKISELKKLLPEYEIVKSLPFFIEIIRKGVSKGSAINTLNKILKIENENTYCFGDSDNDLSMFELPINKIAVANANDTVKAKADEVIDSCQNFGVMQFIKKFYRGE